MAKVSLVKGTTSYLARVFLQDNSKTDGSGLSGLAYNSSGLTCYQARDDDGNAAGTAVALVTATRGTWTSKGFVEKDATNMPGVYEFGVPNAALATGSKSVMFCFQGATHLAPCVVEIELTGNDNQDAVRGGMSALPNAAANAAGGLPVSSAGGLDLDEMNVDIEAIQVSTAGLTFTVSNQLDCNPLSWKSGTIVAPNVTGVPIVDWKYLLGTVLTEGAGGRLAAAVIKFFNVAASTLTTAGVDQTGDSYVRIGAAGVGLSAIPDEAGVTTLLARLTATRAGYLDNLSGGAVALASGVVLTTAGKQAVADEFLNRNIAGGSDGGRTVGQAIQTLRNKQGIVAGVYTCYETDDATPLFEANVTTAAGNPMSAWAPTT